MDHLPSQHEQNWLEFYCHHLLHILLLRFHPPHIILFDLPTFDYYMLPLRRLQITRVPYSKINFAMTVYSCYLSCSSIFSWQSSSYDFAFACEYLSWVWHVSHAWSFASHLCALLPLLPPRILFCKPMPRNFASSVPNQLQWFSSEELPCPSWSQADCSWWRGWS